jgi:hypothetical protein
VEKAVKRKGIWNTLWKEKFPGNRKREDLGKKENKIRWKFYRKRNEDYTVEICGKEIKGGGMEQGNKEKGNMCKEKENIQERKRNKEMQKKGKWRKKEICVWRGKGKVEKGSGA